MGNRVEIVKGLEPGEQIVILGTSSSTGKQTGAGGPRDAHGLEQGPCLRPGNFYDKSGRKQEGKSATPAKPTFSIRMSASRSLKKNRTDTFKK